MTKLFEKCYCFKGAPRLKWRVKKLGISHSRGETKMTDPDNARIEPATPVLPAKDTFRILIMDTVEHTDQLKVVCKNAGHSVIAVHSIREAFSFLDGRDHADVVVCAAHLEDESVFDFLKQLRSNPRHKHAMFMTLSLDPSPIGRQVDDMIEKTGQLLGADAFVSMPEFDPEQLIAEIKSLLPMVPALEADRLKNEKSEKRDSES